MSAVDIIRYWGYPAEQHYVTTKDGYILTIQRIPRGKSEMIFSSQLKRFIFADAGFDVWLGNVRGNTYARNHTTLNPKHKEFWAFSYDEMVQYDLDAMISYALKQTGEESLYYVGHSQGTLIMFAKLSDDPNFHSKVRRVFALAPVATVQYIKGMLEYIATYFYVIDDIFWELFGGGEFLPTEGIMKVVSKWVCGEKIDEWICDNLVFLIMGPESHQFNASRTPVYTSHNPAGTSTQNILHWAQMVRSGRFQKFDYGSPWKNRDHYGQLRPPVYDLSRFNAPLHIYHSDTDWLADEADVDEHLIPKLNRNYLQEVVKLKDYNHIDFIWGLRAANEIYDPIVQTINADAAKL
ncbi:Protein LIPL-1 [Aphelenchoides avenae]|nr:Protein LIPL-1 [Aphelenchus avenae]